VENEKYKGTGLSFLPSIYFVLTFSLWTEGSPNKDHGIGPCVPGNSFPLPTQQFTGTQEKRMSGSKDCNFLMLHVEENRLLRHSFACQHLHLTCLGESEWTQNKGSAIL
jgi:hypothetical protein